VTLLAEGGVDWAVVGVLTPIVVALVTFASMFGRSSGEKAGLQQAIGFQRELVEEKLRGLTAAVDGIRRVVERVDKEATAHRHDDANRFEELGHRVGRIEWWHEQNGDFTPIRDTGRHASVRGRTPPPSTGDTGPGESR